MIPITLQSLSKTLSSLLIALCLKFRDGLETCLHVAFRHRGNLSKSSVLLPMDLIEPLPMLSKMGVCSALIPIARMNQVRHYQGMLVLLLCHAFLSNENQHE